MHAIIPRIGLCRIFAVLFSVQLLLIACGGSEGPQRSAAPRPTATPAGLRIVFLGDSLSAGLGLAEAEAFPAIVGERLRAAGFPVEVVNAGVSGDTSAGGLARVDWVLRQRPRILVVELGGNDALRGQELDTTEDNLRQIVRRARESGAQVLLLGMDVPTNYGPDYTSAFAAIYERISLEEEIPLVPGFVREVGLDPSLLQADGLHPTAEGQQRLAETLEPYLRDLVLEIDGH
jgi:acyl-CoA thioesterase-1